MKVIIPAAGYGTRFLPATKAIPKEMLPVVDKPVIQYIVEEAVASGLSDIVLVTGFNKEALENHFNGVPGLEYHLKKFNKLDQLKKVKKISHLANFIFIRQKGPYGNGTPVLNAKTVIGHNPFAVIWGDDIFMPASKRSKPHLKQLLDVFNKKQDPVITAIPTDNKGTTRYGIIEGKQVAKDIYKVEKILEKPGPKKTKSRLASSSGYILTPDIFDLLERRKKNLKKGEELYLSEAIDDLLKIRPVYAKVVKAKRYDCGNKDGWLKANIELAKKQ